MRAAIVYKQNSLDVAKEVKTFLEGKGVIADLLQTPSRKLENYDFIVSFGGDGTILRILQNVLKCPPIFGINTGRIGLLTHSNPENFKPALEDVIENKIDTEEFMRIECHINDTRLIAMNEIAILSSVPARLIGVSVSVDGVEIENMRGDGILFSTPVGSTAYALSAGGPIVDPSLQSILIVPVAPFKLGWKPWVINANRTIDVKLHPGRQVLAIADGHNAVEVSSDDRIRIVKSKYPAVFFKSPVMRIEKVMDALRKIAGNF
jgi:NAD+ kinase